jgi:hypothetical protein
MGKMGGGLQRHQIFFLIISSEKLINSFPSYEVCG